MSQHNQLKLSEEEFFAWLVHQERRHELVNGEAVMMAGADARHDTIVFNVLLGLGNRLRGKPCRPFTADTAIRIPVGNIRYPDASVDCGKRADRDMTATAPTVVFEVASPSTRAFDREDKLAEYQSVATMRHIVLIDTEEPEARLYSRGPDDFWTVDRIDGVDASIPLPAIDVDLPLIEIYDGVEFRPRPRLIRVE
jgi:Uma2 family endonuclease